MKMPFPYPRVDYAPEELESTWDELERLLEKIYFGIADNKDVQEDIEGVKIYINCLDNFLKMRGK